MGYSPEDEAKSTNFNRLHEIQTMYLMIKRTIEQEDLGLSDEEYMIRQW